MLREVNFELLARRIINESFKVRQGMVVEIRSQPYAFPLVEELMVQTAKAGGHPVLRLTTDAIDYRLLTETPLEYLDLPCPQKIFSLEKIDVSFIVGEHENPAIFSAIDKQRLLLSQQANKPFREAVDNKKQAGKLKTGFIGFPTRQQAKNYGLPYEDYWRIFWQAMEADLKLMREKERKIADYLRSADQIHVTDEAGTDLKFSIKDCRINLDGGTLEEEDLEIGNCNINLPCGEVFIPLVEDSPEGRLVIELAYLNGEKITNLDLCFKQGRMVSVTADEGIEHFLKPYQIATGDKDRLGELGIGTNDQVTRITGDCLLDEKIDGTIHLALGNNTHFGGKNKASIHWDFVVSKPTVKVNNDYFLVKGKFIAERSIK